MTFLYWPYIVIEIYLIVYAGTILFRLNVNLGSEYEVKELKHIIYSYFVVLITDIFWALVEGNLIEPNPMFNAAVNGISLSAVATGCYFWYRFVEYRLHAPFAENKHIQLLLNIPIITLVALNLISIFTGWMFYIDPQDHYCYGPLFVLQGIGTYLYLLIPTVSSIKRAIKTRSRIQRQEYLIYASYMIAPLLAGLLEDLLPTVPILYLNMFMVIHVLFLTIQDMQIYNDALTGLNNRRQLEERLANASSDRPVYVFLLDIDQFKAINDTYGHVEGDHALRIVSESLKRAAASLNVFVARYGGDEFCLVSSGTHDPDAVMTCLHRTLEQVQTECVPQTQYHISISIGYGCCTTPTYDTKLLINQADQRLYEEKKNRSRQL